MNAMLAAEQEIDATLSGSVCKVKRCLGGGGQGEVYHVTLDDRDLALKWYFPHYQESDPRLEERLEKAIESGPPTDRFLWPLELARGDGLESFGYLMPLREPRFKGIVDLMARRITPTFRSLAKAGFELAHSYYELHAKGLCYRDINFENVFFDPETGAVRICDNDNVDVNRRPGGVAGTPRFMAPEVVRGELDPSIESDRFSLAVLLFYLLFIHHPLEGAQETKIHALDLPAMRRLYGTHPVFIFDPENDSNRPLEGHHDNAIAFWKVYPEFLKERFVKAFTLGLERPDQRVIETLWRADMMRLHDSIFICRSCQAQNFYDVDRLRASGPGSCWRCSSELSLPWRIQLENETLQHLKSHIVMLNSDTRLYPHHVDPENPYDFSRPVAEMSQHPKKPGTWGLKNLSRGKWTCWGAEGELREVEPGQSFLLSRWAKIGFGKVSARIRA